MVEKQLPIRYYPLLTKRYSKFVSTDTTNKNKSIHLLKIILAKIIPREGNLC